MNQKRIEETSMLQMVSHEFYTSNVRPMNIPPEIVKPTIHAGFKSIASYLAMLQNSNQGKKLALIIKSGNDEFVMAGFIENVAGEGEEVQYSVGFTFDKADVEDAEVILNAHDNHFLMHVVGTCHSMQSKITFHEKLDIPEIFSKTFDGVRRWLEQNAAVEELSVLVDDVVSLNAKVVNGEKEISITPLGELKTLFKNDKN